MAIYLAGNREQETGAKSQLVCDCCEKNVTVLPYFLLFARPNATVATQDAIRFRCQVCSEYDLCAV
jgi:hypothetical protein